jgi:hypothetical protein
MTTTKLIEAVERGGHAAAQTDLDLFVKAADDLAAAVLDADEVCRAIHALDAGNDDHDEVRWTVLHGIEHQKFEDYALGLVRALVANNASRWARLMTERLTKGPWLWPRFAALLAGDPAIRAAWIAALRAVATATSDDGFGKLADAI